MKTKLIVLSALMASILSITVATSASGTGTTALTTGQLTFNWQGVVPTAPVVSTAWAFVDGLDMPYIPGTEQLNFNVEHDTDKFSMKTITAASVKPYEFFIVPIKASTTIKPGTKITRATDAGGKTIATSNGIKAYLGTNPISGGFVGNKQLALDTGKTAAEGKVAITLNGTPLKVGAANGIDVTAATGNKEAHVSIQLNAKAAKADVKEGSSISFTAPVIFAVNITTTSSS